MRFLAVALLAGSLSAGTITYSGSGKFAPGTATSAYAAPSETWSFSFLVDMKPAVSGAIPGEDFNAAFTDFTYFLNGSPDAISPDYIEYFATAYKGVFGICFDAICD